ncbi:MAG: hypothetical protein IGS03_08690 [Candidatus Sericytochromatia bacterium]|nr:hypothetical protein [Candidatus Sericytochromatia bacterium]
MKLAHKVQDQWWQIRRRVSECLRALMYWPGRLWDPLTALFAMACGVLLFFDWQQWQINPDWARRAQFYYIKTPVPDYLSRLQILAGLTTRNAEYAVLRDNMERLRLMVETYPTAGGTYPRSIAALHSFAIANDLWILSRNPLTYVFDDSSQIVADYSSWQLSADRSRFKGMVLYEPVSTYGYRIYACNEAGELVQGKTGVFSLSNLTY